MARVVRVVEQIIENACDACYKKDGSATDSVMELTLAGKTWFLCAVHEQMWADQFTQILGDPEENK
jgi:hypothetical protein